MLSRISRKEQKIDLEELAAWKIMFELKGTKKELFDKKKISRNTINRILKNGKGEERLIKKIRAYAATQLQPAA